MSPTSGGTPSTSPQKKKVVCPGEGCNTEVELTLNTESNEWEGDCSKCGLDVGWCIEKVRRDRAVKRLVEREEAENPNTEKKKKKGRFF
jgi:hypothetical protein